MSDSLSVAQVAPLEGHTTLRHPHEVDNRFHIDAGTFSRGRQTDQGSGNNGTRFRGEG